MNLFCLFFLAYNSEFRNSHDEPTVDVHGLKKHEAIECVEKKLRELQLAGMKRLRVIVGKGLHSKMGIAVLKPTVLNAMQKYVYTLFVTTAVFVC